LPKRVSGIQRSALLIPQQTQLGSRRRRATILIRELEFQIQIHTFEDHVRR
jgi:hypothetical protein